MRLTLRHYDTTVTVERERDDLSIDEVLELVESVLRGAGFPIEHESLEWLPNGDDLDPR